jgi:flagellar motility protein MotE (MotC chaperone)
LRGEAEPDAKSRFDRTARRKRARAKKQGTKTRSTIVLAGNGKVASVERVVHVFRSFKDAEQADDEFYANLTPEERLDILLELVEQHRSAFGEAASRFERVHRIIELSQR